MAVLAVFIALGGSAFAFHLGRNSVKSKNIAKNAVTASKIKAGAVTAPKVGQNAIASGSIRPGAVTGTQIADGAVSTAKIPAGAVGSSQIADGSIGLGDVSASLHLSCPTPTTYVQGACVQNAEAGGTDWVSAVSACNTAGGRLPTPNELFTLAARGVNTGALEWTDSESFDGINLRAMVVGPGTAAGLGLVSGTKQYRCVFDPTG